MSETKYLKCPCQVCGGPIEFPAHGIGVAMKCPHCGEKTTLFAPPIQPAADSNVPGEISLHSVPEMSGDLPVPLPRASRRSQAGLESAADAEARSLGRFIWPAGFVLVLLGAGAFFFLFKDKWSGSKSSAGARSGGSNQTAPTISEISSATSTNAPSSGVKAMKSKDDLQVGPITLEKSKGNRLVYAVGVMRNNSDHQRFGINLELELMDAKGNKIELTDVNGNKKAATARDYHPILEPRQQWRFRALVLDSRAVSAKVLTIGEEK